MTSRSPGAFPTVVVSIGGSVLVTGDHDREYLERLAELLRRVGRALPLVVTVGGGRTARDYIHLGRELGLTEIELDEIGIEVTRLHAMLLAAVVGSPTSIHPPTTIVEAVHEAHRTSPVVLGGTEPGHTTDGVAALLACRLRATRLVNATNVAGLYDRDPRLDPSAHRVPHLTWKEFRAVVHNATTGEAGQRFLFDRLGVDLLARAGIPLAIVDGRDLPNLEAAIVGKTFTGSLVEDGTAGKPLVRPRGPPSHASRGVPRATGRRQGHAGLLARARAGRPAPLDG